MRRNERSNRRDYDEDEEELQEEVRKNRDWYGGIDPAGNYKVLQHGHGCVQIKYRGKPIWVPSRALES